MLQTSFHTVPLPNELLDRASGAGTNKPNVPNRSKPTNVIKCSVCPKIFKRSEHCARHELSHTKERPFTCQFCGRTYARKDLVKRHERTIHADVYNTLTTSDDPKQKQGSSHANALSLQVHPSLQGRTNSPQSSQDGSGVRDLAILENITLASQHETATNSRPATVSSAADAMRTDAHTSASRAPSILSSLPPPDAIASSNVAASSVETNRGANTLTAEARIPGQSPQSPMSNNEHFDFNINDLLAVSPPYAPLSGSDNHIDIFETEQRHNKRQRLSDDSGSLQAIQNDGVFQFPASSTIPLEEPRSMLHPSDLMDIDLIMGDASNEFFFHQINQQHNRRMDTSKHISDHLGTSDLSNSAFSDPSSGSPGQNSDSISDGGTERPDRIRLPMILKEQSENPRRLAVDDVGFEALCADARERLGNIEIEFPLKNRRELQHFLNGYLDCFHRHFPILHIPSLKVAQTPSPLLLAICCIGALYRLDRQKARKIYLMAVRLSEASSAKDPYCSPVTSDSNWSLDDQDAGQAITLKPLWLMQARILLLLYAVLGNNNANTQSEIARMGVFITDYRSRRIALQTESREQEKLCWREWIEIESTKRYLCATFICSSLLVLAYDVPPAVGITHDLDIGLLEEEKLWNAATDENWQALREFRSSSPARTIRSVMGDMLAGKTDDGLDISLYYVSGFTMLFIIHALNMYAWNLSQFSHVCISPFSDLSGVAPNTLRTNALTTLVRCREVLQLARPEGVESLWNNPEGPLLLNCEAMLRVAYTRLFLNASMPQGLVLLLNTPEENVRLLASFVTAPQERTPLVTKVMASMCEAFSVPAKASYLLVQKTAAISWSVEHALAGWGCVLLLSKWLQSLDVQFGGTPLAEAELEIISQVKTALEGMDIEYDENGSLAAAVVRSWAPLMTDVWVWGITTKMGAILMDLAQVYEAASRNARRQRLRNRNVASH